MTSTGLGGLNRPHDISPEREVSIMAASIPVELLLWPYGYYAGDFSSPRYVAPAAWHTPIPAFDPQLS